MEDRPQHRVVLQQLAVSSDKNSDISQVYHTSGTISSTPRLLTALQPIFIGKCATQSFDVSRPSKRLAYLESVGCSHVPAPRVTEEVLNTLELPQKAKETSVHCHTGGRYYSSQWSGKGVRERKYIPTRLAACAVVQLQSRRWKGFPNRAKANDLI